MNNPVIYWVIGGLLILFFFYLMYQFTKTWRIWHVMFAFLVFGGAIALCAFTSMTLRTHNAWRTVVRQQRAKVAEMTSERDRMLNGNLVDVEQTEPTIRQLNAEIGRVLMDRGRVWRGCTLTLSDPAKDEVVVTLPPFAEGTTGTPVRLNKDSIVSVFIELEASEEEGLPLGTKVPAYYVGEFTAAADSTDSVTLRPLFPLSNPDKGLLRETGVTWSIYDTMPVDGHRFFAADPNEDPDLRHDNADEEPVFGKIDDAILNRTFARQGTRAVGGEQLQALIMPYERDGKRSSEDDPPDNVWLKVKFVKKYEEVVDTAGDAVGAIKTSEDFFDQGRAEIALLRRGDVAKFKPDEVGLFPQEDGMRLINDGVVELIERVYVRSLNDYEGAFRDIAQMLTEIDEDAREVQRDTADAKAASALVEAQIQYREEERTKITEDLRQFEMERDRITEYASTLEAQWDGMRTELSELYRVNQELVQRLVKIDRAITAEANRRTRKAAEEVEGI